VIAQEILRAQEEEEEGGGSKEACRSSALSAVETIVCFFRQRENHLGIEAATPLRDIAMKAERKGCKQRRISDFFVLSFLSFFLSFFFFYVFFIFFFILFSFPFFSFYSEGNSKGW